MKKRIILPLLAILCCFITSQSFSQITVIHAGEVLVVPGKAPKKNQTIVIENGKIKMLRDGFQQPAQLGFNNADVTILDLEDKFLMPGFIDMHTHITGERDANKNPHEWTTLEEADAAFEAIPYVKRTLDAGFTTVRNLGGDPHVMNALKRAIAKGLIEGPRIIASNGAVSATGGHGDFHGYNSHVMEAVGTSESICNGSDDCSRAVRALVKGGADVIKITATGGVLSNTAAGVGQQLTDAEMKSIVTTAHSLGRKVAAHAHEAEGVNAALRAGVNSIEHGSYLNDESIKLFQKTGAYLVPTLLAGVSVYEELSVNPNIPPAIVEKIKQVAPVVEASFKKALKGNINIAFGTDSGVSKHGTNGREFQLMVKYGMDENEAIKTATTNAAALLGMENQLGTLEKGMQADIVAVDGNPLTNIDELVDIDFVMKGGVVYKSGE